MSKDTADIRVRVYETQIDDSGKKAWLAEAGWPSGIGAGWIVFAETRLACASESEAIGDLYAVLHRKWRASEAGLRRLGIEMLRRGFRLTADGKVRRMGRFLRAPVSEPEGR